MFYETHHKLSHRAGGVWIALTFNGEESPLVSKQSLEEQRQKYGSREDAQYKIRVLGEFPDLSDEFLITKRQTEEMYVGASILMTINSAMSLRLTLVVVSAVTIQ